MNRRTFLHAAAALGASAAWGRARAAPTRRAPRWRSPSRWPPRAVGDCRHVGLFRRVRGTRVAALDSAVYTPLCATLAAAIPYLAGV